MKNYFKDLLNLSAPQMIGSLIAFMGSYIGLILVSRIGVAELGSVGLSVAILFPITTFIDRVIRASTSEFSALSDSKDELFSYFWNVVYIGCVLVLIITPGIIYLESILSLFNIPEILSGITYRYLMVALISLPALVLLSTLMCYLASQSIVSYMKKFGLFSAFVMIFLSIPLTSMEFDGETLGAVGLSLAITVSYYIMSIALSIYLILKHKDMNPGLPKKPNLSISLTLLKLGMPVGLSALIRLFSYTFVALTISSIGTSQMASYQFFVSINQILNIVVLAMATATLVLVGKKRGVIGTVSIISFSAALLVVIIAVAITSTAYIFSPYLFILYGLTDEVSYLCSVIFPIFIIDAIFLALNNTNISILNGLKKTNTVLGLHIFFYGLILIPLVTNFSGIFTEGDLITVWIVLLTVNGSLAVSLALTSWIYGMKNDSDLKLLEEKGLVAS